MKGYLYSLDHDITQRSKMETPAPPCAIAIAGVEWD